MAATAFSTMLTVPASLLAQGPPRYEDRGHHDSHEWNPGEEQAYQRYLAEKHRKRHDFAKASKREQQQYWAWRHSHPDEHR